MKRIQIRALTLAILLTLTLCLLPAAAGAIYLDKTELEFTVGEPRLNRFSANLMRAKTENPTLKLSPTMRKSNMA